MSACYLLSIVSAFLFGAAIQSPALEVAGRQLTLRFDRKTGQWIGLGFGQPQTQLLGPIAGSPFAATLDTADGTFPPPKHHPRLHFKQRNGNGTNKLMIDLHWPNWSVLITYRFDDKFPLIAVSADWTYHGAEPVRVTGAALTVPGLRLDGEPSTFYTFPAAWPGEPYTFAGLQPGRTRSESSWLTGHAGIAVVHAPRSNLSILIGHELLLDGSRAVVSEGPGCIHLAHRFNTTGLIQPGQTYRIGVQHVQIVRGDWRATQDALAAFAETLGNGPPADSPDWLDRCVIYSCHPRGPIDVGFNGGGGLNAFAQYLPYLAEMGLNTVWLNPIYHKPPWIYTITDYRAVAKELGTKDDLKRFVARAHDLDQRVWLDLVSHGPAKDSPSTREVPPEAWARDQDGRVHLSWGHHLTGDYTHPAWQKYMADVAAYWVEEFGVDGYRHDCGHGSSGRNWSPDAPYRPSAAGPFGGVMLSQVVRDRIRKINPQAALFSETGGPVFFRSADLVYDYPFYLGCRELTYGVSLDEWIPRMRRWLQLSKLTYPRRALRGLVRFLENHDTVRSAEYFGVGPSQALTALAILAQGTPMIYQEQEIGSGPLLRRWLVLRDRLGELRAGQADYECVRCSASGVLAFLRKTGNGAAVVAINLTGRAAHTTLTWPAELAGRLPVVQSATTGRGIATDGNRCSLTVPPYRPVVLALRTRPDPALARKAKTPNAPTSRPRASLVLAETQQKIDGGGMQYRLTFRPVATWFVETGEGVLLDEFVDRHRPGAMPTLAFCWQPLTHGLWDLCTSAAMGVRAADGRQVRLERIEVARLTDARIEDGSRPGRDVQIVLVTRDNGPRPYVLAERSEPTEPQPLPTAADAVPGVSVDPFHVRLSNRHYTLTLARRHGGTIAGLALGGEPLPRPGTARPASEVYTDWGLYNKGKVIGTREEPKPRLVLTRESERNQITFAGTLRGSSWNTVQRGWPARPLTRYRLTYRVDDSPVVRLTLGLTSSNDRPATSAFFAYRWEINGVDSWSATMATGTSTGRPGPKKGQRVFQSALLEPNEGPWTLSVWTAAGEIQIRHPPDAASHPANTFLLDGGEGRVHLFVALLNGNKVDLQAGREHAGTVELVLNPQPHARSD